MPTLYDLAGADPGFRFSPYCWRVKLALALKGVPYDTVPVRFTDKALIAFSGQDKVPVLVDGTDVVPDSAAIAAFLDKRYPGGPSLLGDAGQAAVTAFLRYWTERVLHPLLLPLILLDLLGKLAPEDQDYFRRSREKRFCVSLEAYAGDPAHRLAAVDTALAPLRVTLAGQPFLAGEAPAWADCLVFGALQWAHSVRPAALMADEDPVATWHARCRALCGA